jgi:hypothetical protein
VVTLGAADVDVDAEAVEAGKLLISREPAFAENWRTNEPRRPAIAIAAAIAAVTALPDDDDDVENVEEVVVATELPECGAEFGGVEC